MIGDYKAKFGDEAGKNILADLKTQARFDYYILPKGNCIRCGMAGGGHIDPFALAVQEGQRSVIIHIERKMNHKL